MQVDGIEQRFGGDVAIVGQQYSDAPSWATFLFSRDDAEESATALFTAVGSHIAAMPAEDRPGPVPLRTEPRRGRRQRRTDRGFVRGQSHHRVRRVVGRSPGRRDTNGRRNRPREHFRPGGVVVACPRDTETGSEPCRAGRPDPAVDPGCHVLADHRRHARFARCPHRSRPSLRNRSGDGPEDLLLNCCAPLLTAGG